MGKHGRRNRNRQQNQYQDEGNDAQDFFDSRRGFQKPNSKQSLNPFERYLRLPPPYQATNPHPRPNSSAFLHPSHNPRSQGRNPFSNTPHGPRIPPDPNLAKRKNRQRTLKRFLIQTLNTAVQKINLYLPDNDAFSSSDSDTEEEMDWQPEHEVIIPQPFEVVYPWPAGDVRGCFERAAWGEGENGYAREMEERVKLKLERGVWMANANRGLNGDGATGRRVRYEVGRKRDWDEESMPDSP